MTTLAQAEALRAASLARFVEFVRQHQINPDTVLRDSVHIGQRSVTFQRLVMADGSRLDPDDRTVYTDAEITSAHERIAITPEIAADLLGRTL